MQLDASVRGEYHDRLMAWLSPAIREKVNEMLEEHFPYPQSDFAKEHYGKGVADGRSEGLSEGVQKGEATLLLRMLTLRFGELPAERRRTRPRGRWRDAAPVGRTVCDRDHPRCRVR